MRTITPTALLTLVLISGCGGTDSVFEEDVSAATVNGLLTVDPTNPRYFTDNSGKAIYLSGSHTWTNIQNRKGKGSGLDLLVYVSFVPYAN